MPASNPSFPLHGWSPTPTLYYIRPNAEPSDALLLIHHRRTSTSPTPTAMPTSGLCAAGPLRRAQWRVLSTRVFISAVSPAPRCSVTHTHTPLPASSRVGGAGSEPERGKSWTKPPPPAPPMIRNSRINSAMTSWTKLCYEIVDKAASSALRCVIPPCRAVPACIARGGEARPERERPRPCPPRRCPCPHVAAAWPCTAADSAASRAACRLERSFMDRRDRRNQCITGITV
jgi:hypothetical protein